MSLPSPRKKQWWYYLAVAVLGYLSARYGLVDLPIPTIGEGY